jgi:formylmethanofuran dehydrogenase subunit E-like metal-binding protein
MILIDRQKRKLGGTIYIDADDNNFVLSGHNIYHSGGTQNFTDIQDVFTIDKRTVFIAMLSIDVIFADNADAGTDTSVSINFYDSQTEPEFDAYYDVEESRGNVGIGCSLLESFINNPYTTTAILDLLPETYTLAFTVSQASQNLEVGDYSIENIRLSLLTLE